MAQASISITQAYTTLGLEKGADMDAVKKAYKEKALQTHPDKVPEERRAEATVEFQNIGAAYETITKHHEGPDSDDEFDFGPDHMPHFHFGHGHGFGGRGGPFFRSPFGGMFFDDEDEEIYMYVSRLVLRGGLSAHGSPFRRASASSATCSATCLDFPAPDQATVDQATVDQVRAELTYQCRAFIENNRDIVPRNRRRAPESFSDYQEHLRRQQEAEAERERAKLRRAEEERKAREQRERERDASQYLSEEIVPCKGSFPDYCCVNFRG